MPGPRLRNERASLEGISGFGGAAVRVACQRLAVRVHDHKTPQGHACATVFLACLSVAGRVVASTHVRRSANVERDAEGERCHQVECDRPAVTE